MFRKLVNLLVILPLAILFVIFAVANREPVTLSFDPFSAGNPAIGLTLPLFVVIIVVAMFGVVAGSTATWFGQRRWRRAARRNEAEVREARSQRATAGNDARIYRRGEGQVPAVVGTPKTGSYSGPSYAVAERDKQGAK